jgi:carbamoyl-phosphate synthase large subunit
VPKRTDIRRILVIGSGPVLIGQASEFDYAGSQVCRTLREEGYQVVVVNSNAATVMTDPSLADRTYVEPLTAEVVEKVIARERPEALLPTVGGQTGLNLAVVLARSGVCERYGVEVIGASVEAIARCEDRDQFKKAMLEMGLRVAESGCATTVEEGMAAGRRLGLPVVLRPAFTLGGSGGSMVYNFEEMEGCLVRALAASPIGQVLVERSLAGWREFGVEVLRDAADQVLVAAVLEHVDALGVHEGDSMVVLPPQTLTAEAVAAYGEMAGRVVRKVDVAGGAADVQLAADPETGGVVVSEANPRLSRSSALASKATGFPIGRVAARLAVGYTLDEVVPGAPGRPQVPGAARGSRCVFKIPRFSFKKFPQADPTLNTSMKSVGEAMSIGSNFKEALQKGIRSLEIGRHGLGFDGRDFRVEEPKDDAELTHKLLVPNDKRHFYCQLALGKGWTVDRVAQLTRIDRWFLQEIEEINQTAAKVAPFQGTAGLESLPTELLWEAKLSGFSDVQIAVLTGTSDGAVAALRRRRGVRPAYKLVDTCGGFRGDGPYYSTYEPANEDRVTAKRRILILAGGPNRIGQGAEFDTCCCDGIRAVQELGYAAIVVNPNPAAVSTDPAMADRLYLEPLTLEDVLSVVEAEKPEGVIVELGGETALRLAAPLQRAGVPVLGTHPDSMARAKDRGRFRELLATLGLRPAPSGTASSLGAARELAAELGYPVLVRPSDVLSGPPRQFVFDESGLEHFVTEASIASESGTEAPILIDKFLEHAIEVDVDAVADGRDCVVGGILEHIEEAGVHSGDASMVMPPITLTEPVVQALAEQTKLIARELKVVGLMNVQFAIREDTIHVLEVNPGASRTVPFVSRAIGVPLANIATKVMLGHTLADLGLAREVAIGHVAVRQSVFPFVRFPGVDAVLGPEMRSTGEVMGMDTTFGMAYAKGQQGAGNPLPLAGTIFVSVRNADKRELIFIAKKLDDLGFDLVGTEGTANTLARNGVRVRKLQKVSFGRPNVLDMIKNKELKVIINTVSGKNPRRDEVLIRTHAIVNGIPLIGNIHAAAAFVQGIEALAKGGLSVKSLQEYGQHYAPPPPAVHPR